MTQFLKNIIAKTKRDSITQVGYARAIGRSTSVAVELWALRDASTYASPSNCLL